MDILLALLAADFFSGLFHWWEDVYGNPKWPIIGPWIVKPNIIHHQDPLLFTRSTFWMRNYQALIPMWTIAVVIWLCSGPLWLIGAAALAGLANEIHAWAHAPHHKTWPVIVALQDMGVLLSPRQHSFHHHSPFAVNYCTVTNWLNPVLELCDFWRTLEWLLRLAGIKPAYRHDII